MLWPFIAYVVAPSGILLLLMLLSGTRGMERASQYCMAFPLTVGPVTLTAPLIVVTVSTFAFYNLTRALYANNGNRPDFKTDHLLKMQFRLQRNWWIIASNLVLWITNWRLGVLLQRLRSISDAPATALNAAAAPLPLSAGSHRQMDNHRERRTQATEQTTSPRRERSV